MYLAQIKKNKIQKILLIFIIIMVLILFLFPILWSFLTSLKTDISAYSMPPKLFFKPSLENYIDVIIDRGLLKFILNSIIVAVSSTIISLFLGIPLSYMLARTKYKFNNILFIFIFIAYILPPIVLSIPLYVLGAKFGLLDRYVLIIITHISFCISFSVWMLRGFFEEVPREIEESAKVDGCNHFTALIRIVLPIVRPGLVATVIFSIILSWNDFMYALVLTGVRTRTLPTAVAQFLTPHGMFWGEMTAAGIIAIFPILIFSLFFQRYIIRGMTAGAIK